jgi:hypothetical protein
VSKSFRIREKKLLQTFLLNNSGGIDDISFHILGMDYDDTPASPSTARNFVVLSRHARQNHETRHKQHRGVASDMAKNHEEQTVMRRLT